MGILQFLVLAAVSGLGCSCALDPYSLSDHGAKEVLSAGEPAIVAIPLGRLTVIEDGERVEPSRGQITHYYYEHSIAAYEKLGILVLTNRRNLRNGQFQGWGAWFEMTQQGVWMTFTASPGPASHELQCATPEEKRLASAMVGGLPALCLPTGTRSVSGVVQNEPITVGSNHYRAVKGTLTDNAPKLWRDVWSLSHEQPYAPVERFSAVLVHDPFKKAWKTAAYDEARVGQAFVTDSVERLLKH